MAHMIENNEMAFRVGVKPWHGLGVEVGPDATGADMLKAAGLDWQIEKRHLAVTSAQYTPEEIADMEDPKSTLSFAPVDAYRAITRSDNGKVFQVASPYYNPVQNVEVIDFFREYCEAGHARMETVGGLKGGAIVWALAALNGNSDTEFKGEKIKGYLVLATAHDGSMATVGKATQVCVVCWNTLSMALGGSARHRTADSFRLSHAAKFTDAKRDEAKRVMGMASESVQATNKLASDLAQVAIDDKGRLEYVYRLLQGESALDQAIANTMESATDKAIRETELTADKLNWTGKEILKFMLDSPGSDLEARKDTMWGAVNGVTYFADHHRGRTNDSRLAGAWFGEGDRLKKNAVTVAAEIAGLDLRKYA